MSEPIYVVQPGDPIVFRVTNMDHETATVIEATADKAGRLRVTTHKEPLVPK